MRKDLITLLVVFLLGAGSMVATEVFSARRDSPTPTPKGLDYANDPATSARARVPFDLDSVGTISVPTATSTKSIPSHVVYTLATDDTEQASCIILEGDNNQRMFITPKFDAPIGLSYSTTGCGD